MPRGNERYPDPDPDPDPDPGTSAREGGSAGDGRRATKGASVGDGGSAGASGWSGLGWGGRLLIVAALGLKLVLLFLIFG